MSGSSIRQTPSSLRQPARNAIVSGLSGMPVAMDQTDEKGFSRTISPVQQNFRFSTPTDYANGSTSTNFGVRNDAVRYQEEEDGKEVEETDDEEVGTEVGEEPYEQLIRRSQIASQSLEQLHLASRGGEERGSGFIFPPGDFHHFHTSPSQDVSGAVPQRFHQGRESSSVLQNITVRESKRSKARSLDRDYQRRVSFTPSAALHSLGAGVFNGVTRRAGGSDGTSPSPQRMEFHGGQGEVSRVTTGSVKVSPALSSSGSPRGHVPVRNLEDSLQSRGVQLDRSASHILRDFTVTLTFEGQLVQHPVTADMAVLTLIRDTAQIYRLEALDVILVLFGMLPRNLVRGNLLSDPPQIVSGETLAINFWLLLPSLHPDVNTMSRVPRI